MGCDVHMRVEVRVDGAWTPAGRVFESDRDRGPYMPATRELLDELSDGQLLDALAWEGRSLEQVQADSVARAKKPFDPERDDYHRGFRESLSDAARAALAANNDRIDMDSAEATRITDQWRADLKRWGAENPEAAKENDGYVSDDHPLAYDKVVAPAVARIVAVRRRAASLDPAVREEIITATLAYHPFADEEDEGESGVTIAYDRGEGEPAIRVDEPWDGRNYDLFAMLADVRNGRGFAGIATGEGFVPIADPRGIPDDAHPDTRKFMESYGVDGHSRTWHSLAQLRAYDYDQTTARYGVVSAEVYERCKEHGTTPSQWSGGISGPGIVTFDEAGYELWKKRGRPDVGLADERSLFGRDLDAPVGVLERPTHPSDDGVVPYVRMKWGVTYRQAAGRAWFDALDKLAAIVPEGGTDDDVRICLFFDN